MNSVEESIIETQRKIISIQDELSATNDSIIELLKMDNARLTEENAMMRTKLDYLAQELEEHYTEMVEDSKEITEGYK